MPDARTWTPPTLEQLRAVVNNCKTQQEAADRSGVPVSRLRRLLGTMAPSTKPDSHGSPIRFSEWQALRLTCRQPFAPSQGVDQLIADLRRVGARDISDPREDTWDGVVLIYHSAAQRPYGTAEHDMISWEIGRGVLVDGRAWVAGYGQPSLSPKGGLTAVPIIAVISSRDEGAEPDPVVMPS